MKWRCSACQARYKRVGEGPFLTPSDDEWRTFVGAFRPPVRAPKL